MSESESPVAELDASSAFNCPRCVLAIPPGFTFCPRCRAVAEGREYDPAEADPYERHYVISLVALSLGALYALIAVGYTMVYGIIKLINFAHGEIYMLGAVWALLVVGMEEPTGLNLFVAIVPAVILCAGVGMAVDWSAYLSLRRRLG